MATIDIPIRKREVEVIDKAVIRFCGDSGDGMQITGNQFTNTVALYGNDLATFPDYPAEIRAPAGTLPGVSGFQVQFSSGDVYTPGDTVDALVAMNPAALKMNFADLKTNGILIVNKDDFGETDLRKAQATTNPLEDHSLDGYRLFSVELTRLTRVALQELGLDAKSMDRCKNFFALGMCFWLYNRPMDSTNRWLDEKFRQEAAARRSQQARDEGRLFLLRSDRSVPDFLRNSAGASFARHLSQLERKSGSRARLCRCRAKSRTDTCFRALIRLRLLRTFCTNFRCTRISASPLSRRKTKSPRSLRRSARHMPARWRSPRLPAPAWR